MLTIYISAYILYIVNINSIYFIYNLLKGVKNEDYNLKYCAGTYL
jgi:hypothetical protein